MPCGQLINIPLDYRTPNPCPFEENPFALMHKTLAEYDAEWTLRLQSPACPPVLGLVPLSEEDCARITALVESRFPAVAIGLRAHTFLLKLLREHSAITSIWLARKAGAAYDGSFWKRFEAEIGVGIPMNERRHFANEFRRASARSMTNFTVPDERSAWKYAGEFLFQAGLPLYQCVTFADLMHRCEDRFGLPDPSDPEAAEELRDNLLVCLGSVAQTNLRRALQGPAGPAICLSALQVVLAGNFHEINPQLGAELARAFSDGIRRPGIARVKQSARPAFLRLSADLCALEVVGPAQEHALVSSTGIQWVVNGGAERVPRYEDFVHTIGSTEPLEVELRGLRVGTVSKPRLFVFKLDQTVEPFLLFDAETRRQITLGIGSGLNRSLRGGDYYLLHKAEGGLLPAGDRLDWPDGERTLSRLEIRPGVSIKLAGSEFTFQADRHSFIEPSGHCVLTDGGQRVHYAWPALPDVWLPAESLVSENGEQPWTLRLRADENAWTYPLAPRADGGAVVGGMARCQTAAGLRGEGGDVLASLPPGLWRLEVAVFFGARQQAVKTLDYWQGLKSADFGERFVVAEMPVNLSRGRCQGYEFKPDVIQRLGNGGRVGSLVFAVKNGSDAVYEWSRAGIFLESFERVPGSPVRPQPHLLGERFSASVNSRRDLRVWPLPGQPVEIRVGNRVYLRRPAEAASRHLDLSLANLAALYPLGGAISLGGGPLLATFTRPLALCAAAVTGTRHASELVWTLDFTEVPSFVRLRLRNLAGAEDFPCASQPWMSAKGDGNGVFQFDDGVPAVRWIVAEGGHGIQLTAANEGWPAGVWRLECEVSREEAGEWLPAADETGRLAPVFFVGDADETMLAEWAPRARVLWEMCAAARLRHKLPELNALAVDPDALLNLLLEVAVWTRVGTVPALRNESEWLEHLQDDLQIRAGPLLRTQDEDWTAKLLNLASHDGADAMVASPQHGGRLFVRLPDLLALPATAYRQASVNNPLTRSLRWCAELGRRERVIDGVTEDAHLLGLQTLMLFKNCQRFVPGAVPEPGPDEDLAGFQFDSCWRQLARGWAEREVAPNSGTPEWDWNEPLGTAHFLWALTRLEKRYEDPATPNLGHVNRLLQAAPQFLRWLPGRLDDGSVPSVPLFGSPWPDLSDPRNFIENCPRFASVFALAARAAGTGWLPFADVIGWLEAQGAGDQVIPTLVGLAPELFGFYLMFWELAIKTARPH